LVRAALLAVACTPAFGQEPAAAPRHAELVRLGDEAKRLIDDGKFAEAASVGERLLALSRDSLGEHHVECVALLERLAGVYRQAGDLPAAESRWGEALAWREAHQGAGHWQAVNARLALESLRIERRLSAEERQRLEQAALASNKVLPLSLEGRLAEALASAEQAYATWKEVLGESHPSHCSGLIGLATVYEHQGDNARAAELYEQASESAKQVFGEQHPQYADALIYQTRVLAKIGDLARAEVSCRRASEIFKETFGEKNARYVDCLRRLATISRASRHYATAEQLLEQVLQITKEVVGEKHADYALSLFSLGELYRDMGDFARAEPLFRQALEINKTVLGHQHPDYAASLNHLAELYLLMGDYVRAEPLCRQALEIRKAVLGEQHPIYAASLNNLAQAYFLMGDYARAEPLCRQALEIRKAVLGEQHPIYAASLNNLAEVYREMGLYARAEPLLRQASEILKQVVGERHSDYATSLDNLAGLYQSMGDYARAEPLYRQALEIKKTVLGQQNPDYATSLNNLALLYRAMGDYARAGPLFRQALEIRKAVLGEQHPSCATSVDNLAGTYFLMGDYARAEPLCRQALDINKTVLGQQHPDFAKSVNNLALLYRAMGDYARAEPLYRQATELYKRVLGQQHPYYATSLDNLAGLYRVMGDYARAEPLCRQALEIRKAVLGERHPNYATSLNNLALLHLSVGDYTRAEPLYRQALATIVAHGEATAIVQDEAGQLAHWRSVRDYLDSYLSCLLQRNGEADVAYQAVLAWKGAILMRQRAARLAADSADLAPILAELQSTVGQWSALAAGMPPNDPRWKDRWAELTRRKERLEGELSRRSAVYRAATAEVSLVDLQGALPDGAALVDFFEFGLTAPSTDQPGKLDWRRSLVAFVLRPDSEVRMFDLGPVAPISAAIDAWRSSYGASAEAQAAGALLREKLWAPLEAEIGGASLVLISPDGALGRLPFSALPGKNPDRYLIEDATIALVPAPRLIPELVADKERKELPKDLLVVGGVDYDHRAAGKANDPAATASRRRPWERGITAATEQREVVGGFAWSYLSGTESEAAYIAGLYERLMGLAAGSPRVVYLRGPAATEETFRGAAPECYLLHLATHGFFASEEMTSALEADDPQRALRDNPFGERLAAVRGYSPGLLSGLVLAGANDPPKIPDDPAELAVMPDDGYLTAEEIAFLPLSGAQLVVLSACESGLGETAGGEGLLGIQRAFQVAGARTTIATLWKVNDEATRRIMEEFYRGYLEEEMSPMAALRAAQRWALANPDLVPRGADAPHDATTSNRLPPRYWAAFTLSGDWR
jgi:tetratricopeptide (TPR) repeat protein/CHAT domain-containing protein